MATSAEWIKHTPRGRIVNMTQLARNPARIGLQSGAENEARDNRKNGPFVPFLASPVKGRLHAEWPLLGEDPSKRSVPCLGGKTGVWDVSSTILDHG